jgi:two-component system, OmpR family, osmolarity sensor histidine kinase EnvZ
MVFAPRSLLWRTFLLIALVIVLAIGAWVQIFRAYDIEPRTQQIAQMVVSVVNITRTALITAKPELRRELLLDLAEQEGIEIHPAERGEKLLTPPEDRAMLTLLADEIRKHLGPQTRIALARNGERAFWVSFFIDDDEYWVMLPRERVERQLALQWAGWGLLVLVLALLVAYFIVFRIRRPLTALSGAARAIGQGRIPPPIDESGPEEIATVAAAFNQMTRDLARLDEDRALILAGVSHDLRTPLARLRLGIEMSGADERTRDSLAADIEEMDRIIGQFLDFARNVSGEASQSLDAAALAREVARHYLETGHTLGTDIQDTPAIQARPLALRRAISNLLDNAYRYAPTNVSLRVAFEDNMLRIDVMDRGPGIPQDETERMKLPFTRMESARSNAGGSGLGLAIVDRIARMHAGRFELLPREGGGLIARIDLPPKPPQAP